MDPPRGLGKSSISRTSGGEALTLDSQDWQSSLSQKYVKSRVHSSLKATDAELGVCAEGLTKHKSSKNYTKPHIMAQRLELLRTLGHTYRTELRPELDTQSDRTEVLLAVYNGMWVSRVVPEHYFISWDQGAETSTRTLVLGAGPHALRVLPLILFEADVFTFKDMSVPRGQKIVGGLNDVLIAAAEPCLAHDQLGWKQTSGWMSLAQYIADESLLWLPRTLLSKVCSALGLKHSRMDYKERVKCFLRHMGKSEQDINATLDELPDQRKKKSHHDEVLWSELCGAMGIECLCSRRDIGDLMPNAVICYVAPMLQSVSSHASSTGCRQV